MGVWGGIRRLFGAKVVAVPEGVRVYAIGDIHGRHDLLAGLIERIGKDISEEAAGKSTIGVFLGDYIDRGRESKQVIDLLLSLKNFFDTPVFLKGNHEATLVNFLNNENMLDAWRNYGGLETLHSYGVDVTGLKGRPGNLAAQADFLSKLPDEHLDFYRNLQVSYEVGQYFFCHAGVRPGMPVDKQSEEDLLWIRDEFLDSGMNHGKVVVHGHTPVDEVEIWDNRINIDTGAYLSNNLTCLVLDAESKSCL